jgi:acetoin utilization protein AcuB
MLIQDIMQRDLVTVNVDVRLADAYKIMQDNGIRHLPVMSGGELVGIVTDRDLRLATSALTSTPFPPDCDVEGVMNQPVQTADPLDPVETAARTMRESKIGCLPVLDNGKLAGIVTGIDLLDALIRLTGVDKPSGRLDIRLQDHPGELARLTHFISERHVNIHSILTYREGGEDLRAVLRIGSMETRPLAQALSEHGFKILWPPAKPWSN